MIQHMREQGKFFIEMSRDETHGGGSWSFLSCVFAPTEKKGGGNWPFWSKILDIRTGDIVLHLRGIPPDANFVGYSIAAGQGHVTSQRPPDPGAWSYSGAYCKADLRDFVPFQPRINLDDVFDTRNKELREYFATNKAHSAEKLHLFYVIQDGKLQCLNGAYFSEGDAELLEALFGDGRALGQIATFAGLANVYTAEGVAHLKTRIGQRDFSIAVKAAYSNKCCFPKCPIDDQRFLVASHIARWSDAPQLRGNLQNGLCLCVFHDKAFETGVFTIDSRGNVFVNPNDRSKTTALLRQFTGVPIRRGSHPPLADALLEHWVRVSIDPLI